MIEGSGAGSVPRPNGSGSATQEESRFKLLKHLIVAGCELEKMSEDMSVALPILTKNEKLLRGLAC
jgi:hypothetical protein